jgi:hypothetical protein
VAITVDGERAGVAGRGAADLLRLLGCDRSLSLELGDIDQEFHRRHAKLCSQWIDYRGIWGCNVARRLAAAAQIPWQLCRTTKVGADPLRRIAQPPV